MTKTINRYRNYKVDHTTFGGLIYPSDFNPYPSGTIAGRIENDKKFDHQCRINIMCRQNHGEKENAI